MSLNGFLMRILIYPVLLYLTVLAVSPSCSTIRHEGIGPTFDTYVEDFQMMHGRKVNVNIGFSIIDGPIIGVCNYLTNSISIDKNYWYAVSEEKKLILMYHELGHCVLYKAHTKKKFEDGCPTSLMHPEIPSDTCIDKYKDYYLLEIFL